MGLPLAEPASRGQGVRLRRHLHPTVPGPSRQLLRGKVQCRPSLKGRPMIHVVGLVKSYGTLRAVDGVSFDVAKGELYGLLGPNGAGKTTTMSMLSGLLAPDEGRILCDGVDLAAHPLKVK